MRVRAGQAGDAKGERGGPELGHINPASSMLADGTFTKLKKTKRTLDKCFSKLVLGSSYFQEIVFMSFDNSKTGRNVLIDSWYWLLIVQVGGTSIARLHFLITTEQVLAPNDIINTRWQRGWWSLTPKQNFFRLKMHLNLLLVKEERYI